MIRNLGSGPRESGLAQDVPQPRVCFAESARKLRRLGCDLLAAEVAVTTPEHRALGMRLLEAAMEMERNGAPCMPVKGACDGCRLRRHDSDLPNDGSAAVRMGEAGLAFRAGVSAEAQAGAPLPETGSSTR